MIGQTDAYRQVQTGAPRQIFFLPLEEQQPGRDGQNAAYVQQVGCDLACSKAAHCISVRTVITCALAGCR